MPRNGTWMRRATDPIGAAASFAARASAASKPPGAFYVTTEKPSGCLRRPASGDSGAAHSPVIEAMAAYRGAVLSECGVKPPAGDAFDQQRRPIRRSVV
jgi:hypothetical protein